MSEPVYDNRRDGPIHGWFELSYAKYLTMPRSLLQSMPVEWQERFAQCLREFDEHFDWRPENGRYWVMLKDGNGHYASDPFDAYRHAPIWTPEAVKALRPAAPPRPEGQ